MTERYENFKKNQNEVYFNQKGKFVTHILWVKMNFQAGRTIPSTG